MQSQFGVVLFSSMLAGLAPAHVAHNKGRSFLLWWFLGSMLWIVFYPWSLLLDNKASIVGLFRNRVNTL